MISKNTPQTQRPVLVYALAIMLLLAGLIVFLRQVLLSSAAVNTYNHVVVVSIDGLNATLLQTAINNDTSGDLGTFQRLMSEGAYTFNARTDYFSTSTLPNHTTMLTGRPVGIIPGQTVFWHHGYLNNDFPAPTDTLHNQGNPNVVYFTSIFDIAHDHGLKTGLYASKDKFIIFDQSYNASNGRIDTIGANNGRDKIDFYVNKEEVLTANAMHADYLNDLSAEKFNLSFVHYRTPDATGHVYNWGSPEYNSSLGVVDAYLADIMAVIENDATMAGNTMLILTTDHGGGAPSDTQPNNHGNPTKAGNYTIPFFVWGPDVVAGADLYALNLHTRNNPNTIRTNYNTAVQPIRNGDVAALALFSLGLPSIEGSWLDFPINVFELAGPITGSVFVDEDRDGIFDSAEPGAPGVDVNLQIVGDFETIATVTTDLQGNYSFPVMAPANYVVQFDVPIGSYFSPKDVGGNDQVDSDVNGSSGLTDAIEIGSNAGWSALSAGFWSPATAVQLVGNSAETSPSLPLIIPLILMIATLATVALLRRPYA